MKKLVPNHMMSLLTFGAEIDEGQSFHYRPSGLGSQFYAVSHHRRFRHLPPDNKGEKNTAENRLDFFWILPAGGHPSAGVTTG